MAELPSHASLANMALIEELYARYQQNPESVDPSWRHFFEGIDFGALLYQQGAVQGADASHLRIADLVLAYRRFGHLQAQFNPLIEEKPSASALNLEALGFFSSELDLSFPTMGFCGKPEASLRELIQSLEAIYCGPIGFEYMDLGRPDLEKWVQDQIEPQLNIHLETQEKHLLLESMNKSEVFETFLHTKYMGQTRFSLEGAETLIPILAEIIDYGANLGIEEFLIGMAHRGRLNVLTNILNKPYELILEEFEDDTSLSFSGNDDVRYHMGYASELKGALSKSITVGIAANPSHLESVDPVVLGQTRAKIVKRGDDYARVAPILVHGDASIAGQGVVYESLQLMGLPSYSVGGTIHLVVNNQIGYTTLPQEGRSTRYCTDIAKTFGCPVFHVNAEDPESCLFATKLAVAIRQKFHLDVFIDLLCYRKYGHNEGDEPSFTQPLQYQTIRSKPSIRQIYLNQLLAQGNVEQKLAETLELQFKETMKKALEEAQEKIAAKKPLPAPTKPNLFAPVSSGVQASQLQQVLRAFCQIPQGFHLHPKLQKWLQDRSACESGKVDWATAEMLAIGSLLDEKVAIRFAGQDAQRGTFSQRHFVWVDMETGQMYAPLSLSKTRFEVVNSPLSEYAGLGFEYGYSWEAKDALVLWEAQYGDFYNGAQIIVDQYLVNAEQKWNCISSLVMLLPHGYEGAGPEHSSARMERFLQLSANSNIQVVNASTPAQYFHLLRRQALRAEKKPLIVFTPKSLLRAPACTSHFQELCQGSFQEILDDPVPPKSCRRLIFCSGKIFYDLIANRKSTDIAIVRIEQLYPLHEELLKKILAKYKGFQQCFWVQEEPQNMGAWNYIRPFLPQAIYVGREENATTATGSNKKHKQEQQAIIEKALS